MNFTFPVPLSINHIYGRTRTGLVYKKKEAKDWIKECLWIIKSHPRAVYKPTDDIMVCVELYYADNRKHDIDNCMKLTLDLLSKESGLIPDDNQVVHLNIVKFTGCLKSEMRVQIEVLK